MRQRAGAAFQVSFRTKIGFIMLYPHPSPMNWCRPPGCILRGSTIVGEQPSLVKAGLAYQYGHASYMVSTFPRRRRPAD